MDSSEGDVEQDEDMIEVIVVRIWIFLVGLVKFCMHVLIWYPFLLGGSKVFISAGTFYPKINLSFLKERSINFFTSVRKRTSLNEISNSIPSDFMP